MNQNCWQQVKMLYIYIVNILYIIRSHNISKEYIFHKDIKIISDILQG